VFVCEDTLVSQIFAAIILDDCGTKKNIRTACLYDGGKIESLLRFWAWK